jgi:hypothetical protein
MTDPRTIDQIKAIDERRVKQCRAVLIETAVALVVQKRLVPRARAILVSRLQVALADLGAQMDDPFYAVRVACDRVVRAHEKPDAFSWQDQTENDLRACLQGLYAARSDAAWALLDRADPVLIES